MRDMLLLNVTVLGSPFGIQHCALVSSTCVMILGGLRGTRMETSQRRHPKLGVPPLSIFQELFAHLWITCSRFPLTTDSPLASEETSIAGAALICLAQVCIRPAPFSHPARTCKARQFDEMQLADFLVQQSAEYIGRFDRIWWIFRSLFCVSTPKIDDFDLKYPHYLREISRQACTWNDSTLILFSSNLCIAFAQRYLRRTSSHFRLLLLTPSFCQPRLVSQHVWLLRRARLTLWDYRPHNVKSLPFFGIAEKSFVPRVWIYWNEGFAVDYNQRPQQNT